MFVSLFCIGICTDGMVERVVFVLLPSRVLIATISLFLNRELFATCTWYAFCDAPG